MGIIKVQGNGQPTLLHLFWLSVEIPDKSFLLQVNKPGSQGRQVFHVVEALVVSPWSCRRVVACIAPVSACMYRFIETYKWTLVIKPGRAPVFMKTGKVFQTSGICCVKPWSAVCASQESCVYPGFIIIRISTGPLPPISLSPSSSWLQVNISSLIQPAFWCLLEQLVWFYLQPGIISKLLGR